MCTILYKIQKAGMHKLSFGLKHKIMSKSLYAPSLSLPIYADEVFNLQADRRNAVTSANVSNRGETIQPIYDDIAPTTAGAGEKESSMEYCVAYDGHVTQPSINMEDCVAYGGHVTQPSISMEDCVAYGGRDTQPSINMEDCVAYGVPTVVPEAGLGDPDDDQNHREYEVVV